MELINYIIEIHFNFWLSFVCLLGGELQGSYLLKEKGATNKTNPTQTAYKETKEQKQNEQETWEKN